MKTFKLLLVMLFLPAIAGMALAFEANDPSMRSPNARVISLGRAFSAVADDAAAIYFNPAGLARQDNWQLSSMSGKFLDDYNYLSLMGYYPTNFGVVGIGYGGYSIGGAYATTTLEGSDPRDPVYIIDPTQPQISNYSNVLTLSYAAPASKLLQKFGPWADKIDVGVSLKVFSSGLSGDHITNGSATGQEMDAGLLVRPTNAVKLSAVAQNLLPTSWGGKLTYLSGHSESYPVMMKLGGAVKVLGEENSVLKFMKQDVTAALDLDWYPTTNTNPVIYHLGAEWLPLPIVAVRLGLDQSPADDGTGKYQAISNMTYGLGFNYAGFKFDYAYHQFAGLPIDNSYFSLSYNPITKAVEIKEKVKLTDPKDKSYAFDAAAKVKGQILDPSIKLVEINKNKVDIPKSRALSAEVPLMLGKNKIEILSYGEKGKLSNPVNAQKIRVLRLVSFPDVTEGYWARTQVSLISMLNIVTGYPDGTFQPEGNITRAEMAALLMRTQASTTNAPANKFIDVKPNHWANQFIASAAEAAVVEGYPDRTFRPKGNITRAEGLAMAARFAKVTLEAYSFQYFPDINQKNWASSIIAGSYKAGLLDYLKGKSFEPKRALTRAEAVEILYRTQFAKKLLDKDLLNWDSY